MRNLFFYFGGSVEKNIISAKLWLYSIFKHDIRYFQHSHLHCCCLQFSKDAPWECCLRSLSQLPPAQRNPVEITIPCPQLIAPATPCRWVHGLSGQTPLLKSNSGPHQERSSSQEKFAHLAWTFQLHGNVQESQWRKLSPPNQSQRTRTLLNKWRNTASQASTLQQWRLQNWSEEGQNISGGENLHSPWCYQPVHQKLNGREKINIGLKAKTNKNQPGNREGRRPTACPQKVKIVIQPKGEKQLPNYQPQ